MKHVLSCIAAAGLATTAMADVVSYNGIEYQTVQWSSVSSTSNTATGMAGDVSVSYDAVDIYQESIMEYDYTQESNGAYDALSFGQASVESLWVRGGRQGTASLSFGSDVSSVLMIIGNPDTQVMSHHFGPATWDFADSLNTEIVDSTSEGLAFGAGNVLSNSDWEAGVAASQVGGVIAISGDALRDLSWVQDAFAGTDTLRIGFAVASSPVPAPGALALLLPGAAMIRRRR